MPGTLAAAKAIVVSVLGSLCSRDPSTAPAAVANVEETARSISACDCPCGCICSPLPVLEDTDAEPAAEHSAIDLFVCTDPKDACNCFDCWTPVPTDETADASECCNQLCRGVAREARIGQQLREEPHGGAIRCFLKIFQIP